MQWKKFEVKWPPSYRPIVIKFYSTENYSTGLKLYMNSETNWDSTQNQNGWLKSIILILYDPVPIYQAKKKNPLKRLMVKWPFYKPPLVRMY